MQQQKRFGRGIQLSVMGTMFAVPMQAVVTVVLLRLLDPSDYAQYAIAALVGAFSTQATVTVLERAAMLLPDEEGLKGAGLAFGLVVLGSGCLALTVLISLFEVGLIMAPIWVIATLLAGNVVTGFSVIPRVLMRRRMRYGPIVGSEIIAQVVGTGLVTVVLAAAGLGALAIVLGGLVGAIIALCAMIVLAGREAYWPVRITGHGRLAAGAARVLETSLIETTIVQIPVIVVSFLGATTLGLFNRAMNLVQLPVQMVTSAVSRVFVSELVRAAPEADRFRGTARRMIVLTTATLSPVCAGIAGAAHEFTAVVMGPNWIEAEHALPYFAMTAAAMLVASICGTIVDANGQLRAKSRLLMVSAAIMLVGAIAALPLGLVGVAMALTLANLAQIALLIGFVGRQTQTAALQIARWFVPGVAAGAICFGWSVLVSALLDDTELVVLGIQIVGNGLWASSYYLAFHRSMVREVVELLRH